ncbi:MAG: hypothetical protein ACHP7P_12605 [Terriglobales bacterium]
MGNMGIRENFQKLINKKQEEIASLELQIREAKAYVQALQDSMKLLPREGNGVAVEYTLRSNSALAKARDALRARGAPMPIADILKALDKPNDKKHRSSLSGTLSGYARDGKIFTRTAPNTFGLLEFGQQQNEDTEEIDDELPEEFGSMEKRA